MIGIVILAFGIILKDTGTLGSRSGIMFWGSVCFVMTGCLAAAVLDNRDSSVVKSSLLANAISIIAALVAVILFSVDLWHMDSAMLGCLNWPEKCGQYEQVLPLIMWYGIYGALVSFALLEFIISICTSVFACKVTCITATQVVYSQPQVYTQTTVYTQPQVNTQQLAPPPMYNPTWNQQVPQPPPPPAPVINYNMV
ncbi:Membrane-spanning 4-domains subfamily A member 15 [Bagarius yarrelli]|uniref:Membrane-spanning 4-domains subfamily A member 15 n=1 Tax=Bagarius yarrelli TaxID=175774 RepID=A0A556VBV8_BAGYA|nr:Membrane-spanning 4-domains subfamily A member 15 [Bagarius yarrelli]